MFDQNKAFMFVEEYLKSSEHPNIEEYKEFRIHAKNKFQHIKRVYKNAKTLCYFADDVDSEVVEAAAIFHDVGGFASFEQHATIGAEIARGYLLEQGLDTGFIEKVCYAISKHSDKTSEDGVIDSLSLEDKILIDADILDYSGVKEIIWSAMQQGKNEISYEDCLKKINESISKMEEYLKIVHTNKAKELLLRNYMMVKGIVHTFKREINGENI